MGRLKRYVLIGLAAAGVGAVVVTAGALRTYHEATKIDRSQPASVVGEYIDAFLAKRDDSRAALFSCSEPMLDELAALRDQLIHEERENRVTTRIVLGATIVEESGRLVITDLQIDQGAGLHVDRRTQRWKFVLVDEDGWRVCGAEQIATPSPSATPPTTS